MNLLCRIYRFYREGFHAMTWGRTLWALLVLKLLVLFLIFRLCLFRPYLRDCADKGAYVGNALIERKGK